MTTDQVILVGHCGPDAFMLRSAVQRLSPSLQLEMINDAGTLEPHLGPHALLLVNRELDGEFTTRSGLELIADLHAQETGVHLMLVSNFEDAQETAVNAGALPGFGKSHLYDSVFRERLGAVLDI